jgi:Family of unknown function (DUF6508)
MDAEISDAQIAAIDRLLEFLPIFEDPVFGPCAASSKDETQDGGPLNLLGVSWSVEFFANATVDQFRRYFMAVVRGERFCDGHIDGEFRAATIGVAG